MRDARAGQEAAEARIRELEAAAKEAGQRTLITGINNALGIFLQRARDWQPSSSFEKHEVHHVLLSIESPAV